MSNNEKEKKSLLNPKARQIIDIVFTTVQVLIVILCIVFSVIVWTGAAGDPASRKLNWFAIRTDSMTYNEKLDYAELGYDTNLCFNPGDMVICRKVPIEDIKVGDVVAYVSNVKDTQGNTSRQIVTHRVIEILPSGAFVIAGDKDTARAEKEVMDYNAIIGKMTGKLKGVGGAVLWLQGYKKVTTPNMVGYDYSGKSIAFLVIIIPLAALFLYNGFYVVKWAMGERMKKAKEQAKLEAVKEQANAAIDQEAIRKEALRAMMLANGMTAEQVDAYFASQEAQKVTAENQNSEETNSSTGEDDGSNE